MTAKPVDSKTLDIRALKREVRQLARKLADAKAREFSLKQQNQALVAKLEKLDDPGGVSKLSLAELDREIAAISVRIAELEGKP